MSIKVEGEIRRPTAAAMVHTYREGFGLRSKSDTLITEEPLELRAHGPGQDPVAVATIMRTPGADFELAVGFLLSEGVLASKQDLATVCYCNLDGLEEQRYNVVTVELRIPYRPLRERETTVGSSCGICGTTTIDQIEKKLSPIDSGFAVSADVIRHAPGDLRRRQKLFAKTGGVHGAAIVDGKGATLYTNEDVGRHNALDKVLGKALMEAKLPLSNHIAVLSGRIAFDMVQKAAIAGVPVVVAVGAPTNLAVNLAERSGITLCGFTTPQHFNIYSHPERVSLS